MSRNYLKPFTVLLVIFFFLISMMPHTGVFSTHQGSKEVTISKTSGSSATADTQLPYEEREEEGSVDSSNTLLFNHVEISIAYYTPDLITPFFQSISKPSVSSTPIYLAKRSLLI